MEGLEDSGFRPGKSRGAEMELGVACARERVGGFRAQGRSHKCQEFGCR